MHIKETANVPDAAIVKTIIVNDAEHSIIIAEKKAIWRKKWGKNYYKRKTCIQTGVLKRTQCT